MLLITLTMAPLCLSVPVSHDSVTVSQDSQHQVPETEAVNLIQPSIILLFTPAVFLL